jgi:hypothetical protein
MLHRIISKVVKWTVNAKINNEFWIKTPITVASWSNACNVLSLSNTVIVGSNPTRGMHLCVYSVFMLGSGLATDWSLVQEDSRMPYAPKWEQREEKKKKKKNENRQSDWLNYWLTNELINSTELTSFFISEIWKPSKDTNFFRS